MLERFLTLKALKGGSGGSGGGNTGGSGSEEWIGDGNTHLWITLTEGRTSPMLGVCPKGTVTVDWGDGSEPDVLTGTSTSTVKWTPNHNYTKPSDYVITLTVDGEMGFHYSSNTNEGAGILRHSSGADRRNTAYQKSLQKVEIGNGIKKIYPGSFHQCNCLSSINIPDSVTEIGANAFSYCNLLRSISIPNSVTAVGESAFLGCTILRHFSFPSTVKKIDSATLQQCGSLLSIDIPNGVTEIGMGSFNNCAGLTFIKIPSSVSYIGMGLATNCYSLRYIDFTSHTTVPEMNDRFQDSFFGTPDDLEIRVPAALYDEWIAATNWSTYASKIVAV